jgi:hypothetical protein
LLARAPFTFTVPDRATWVSHALAALGLLVQTKVGKAFRFVPADDVEQRLREV